MSTSDDILKVRQTEHKANSALASTPALSLTAHTPGPWYVDGLYIRARNSAHIDRCRYICDIKFPADDPEIQANARLIAAAPDLLEALDYMTNAINASATRGLGLALDKARAALALAGQGKSDENAESPRRGDTVVHREDI